MFEINLSSIWINIWEAKNYCYSNEEYKESKNIKMVRMRRGKSEWKKERKKEINDFENKN